VDLQNQGDMIMPKLLAVFGAIALLLAIIGVYGVMAYSVSQRTQELGIRRALGAEGRDIVRLVLRQGGLLAGLGAGIGLVISLGGDAGPLHLPVRRQRLRSRWCSAASRRPLVGAAVIASLIPARRATRVDPLVALRND
jgi:ABC-type antimicrobial peptide transport system permease subunit